MPVSITSGIDLQIHLVEMTGDTHNFLGIGKVLPLVFVDYDIDSRR